MSINILRIMLENSKGANKSFQCHIPSPTCDLSY